MRTKVYIRTISRTRGRHSFVTCSLPILLHAFQFKLKLLHLTESDSCDRLISIPRCSAAAVIDFNILPTLPCVAGLPDNGEVADLLVLFFLLDLTSPVSAAFLFCVSTLIAADSAFCIFLTAFSAVAMSVPNCSCTCYTKTAVAASFCFTTLPRRIPVSFRHAATMPHTAAKRNRRPDHSEKRQFHPF